MGLSQRHQQQDNHRHLHTTDNFNLNLTHISIFSCSTSTLVTKWFFMSESYGRTIITIKSHDDINILNINDPVMKELTELLIDACTWTCHHYLPNDYGYLLLIEKSYVDKVIYLPELQCRLVDVMWEGHL